MAVLTAITAAVTAASTWLAGLSAVQLFGVRLIAGLAFNALAKALAGKPDAPQGGIESQLQQGADLSRRFLLGRTATAGSLVYHNQWGGGANEYYTRVTALSDLPIKALSALLIDGERSEIDWENPDPDGKGYPILSLSTTRTMIRSRPLYQGASDIIVGYENYEDTVSQHFGWVRFHDGTQTTADSLLTGSVSSTERPWDAADVGHGVAYAVTTFKYDAEKFQGLPQIIFEVDGVPLYDPEQDDTGTGDLLPAVQAHAILSGMSWSGQQLYGPQTAAVMDATEWAAEVAKCRADVPGAATMTDAEKIDAFGSTTVPPRYRAGLEVDVSRPVAEVLEDIVSACNGRISHTGTRYRMQVGDPGDAATTLTDADILSTSGQSFAPFFPLAETVNAISATYPEPDENWQLQDAPTLTNADYEAEEGGRRLPTTVELTAVPYREQVQRLMASALAEARRARRHSVTLPASYWALEVGDFVAWTSARNGYADKLMRVDGLSDLANGDISADLTEVDPTDYNWTAATDYTPVTTGSITDQPLPAWTLSGWNLSPVTLRDGDGTGRRPAILAEWTDPDRSRVRAIRWQLRLAATGEVVAGGVIDDVEAEAQVLPVAVLPGVTYQGRAQIRARNRASTWTAWDSVTTRDLRLGESDLDDPLTTAAVPTGLTLSTELLSDGLARIVVGWSAASGAVAYEVGVTQSGGNEVVLTAGDTAQHIDGLPGITYSIRVRSVSAIGSKSAWSSAQSITSAADSVAPGTPTGLAATGGFNTIWVEWESVAASDLSHYELCVKTSSGTPGTTPTSPVYDVVATAFVHSGLDDDVTRYYYVRAVDTSGNKSGWSSVASASTSSAAMVTVTAADIEGIVDSTSIAAGLTLVGLPSSLPADNSNYSVVSYGGKLYRWDGSKFTASVPAVDVAGQLTDAQLEAISAAKLTGEITSTQISDSAISTPKLAAGAVTTAKIDAGAVTADEIAANAVTAAKISAGAIETDKLAANAVTSDKIIANAVTTAALAAGAVKAEQLDVGAVTARSVGIGDFTNFVAGSSGLWENHPWSIVDSGITYLVSMTDHTGESEKVLNMASSSGAAFRANIDRAIDVVPGEEIYVEFWAYVGTGFNGTAGDSKLRIGDYDSGAVLASFSWASLSAHSWTKISGTYTVAAGVTSLKVSLVADHTAGYARVDDMIIRKKNGGEMIIDGSLKANHVGTNELITYTANIADGIITNAKIYDLSAAKLTAGTALAGSITVSGDALSTIRDRAEDPAARVNAKSTKIDPGKITVSGSTTLSDWRKGGDETKIDGGSISANTIDANKLTIGNRGVSVQNVKFEADAATDKVTWTSGGVRYVGDGGASTYRSVASGSRTYSGDRIYIYFTKGSSDFRSSTDPTTAGTGDNIIVATYGGGSDLTTNYGQTVIDGDHIKTGSITADHVDVTEIVVAGAELGGGIWSSDYVAGVSGWGIFPAGHAQLPATKIIGTLTADRLDLDGLVLENDSGSLTIKGGGIVTDHIGSDAVSVVGANSKASDEDINNTPDSWKQVLTTGNKDWLGSKPLLVMGTLYMQVASGASYIKYRIRVNGVTKHTSQVMNISGTVWPPISIAYQTTSDAGSHAITVEVAKDNASGGTTTVMTGSTVAAFELKR